MGRRDEESKEGEREKRREGEKEEARGGREGREERKGVKEDGCYKLHISSKCKGKLSFSRCIQSFTLFPLPIRYSFYYTFTFNSTSPVGDGGGRGAWRGVEPA